MIIQTQRLILRPISLQDLHTTFAYTGDIQNTAYMIFLPNDSLDDTRTFLANAQAEWDKEDPAFYEFAVLFENRHIGAVSLYCDEKNRTEGELAWIIHSDYHGRGIATEAALALRDFAVNKLKLKTLHAHCDSRNAGSASVMKKIGMSLVSDDGIRYNKSDGKPARELMYSFSAG